MRGHGRFEAMAGAIVLGEATPAEHAQYAAHAHACPRCGADDLGALRTHVLTAVAVSRELETWRPQIREAVAVGIDRNRSRTASRTANALGFAVALSLALNAALASGLAERAAGTLRPVIARLVLFDPMVASRSPAPTDGVP